MKIRILRNLGRGYPLLKEGEIADLPEDQAEALISRGLAEAVAVAKEIRGVPEEAEFKEVIEKVKRKAKADV